MSPLLRNELRVVLCPDKVILLGLGKGLHRKVIVQKVLPCTSLPGVPSWQPAMDTLEAWLDSNEISRANVKVILSNHFVRYALIPFSPDVTSRAEEQALALILMENTYGDPAKIWRLEIAVGGYGEPRLVAAVDEELLVAIENIIKSTTLQLVSIRPYLISAFNSFRNQMQGADGLFALAESGQLVLATFKNEQLFSVRRLTLNGQLNEQLPSHLMREIIMVGQEAGDVPVYLHVTERPDLSLPSYSGLLIQTLRHSDSEETWSKDDVRFDMACSG